MLDELDTVVEDVIVDCKAAFSTIDPFSYLLTEHSEEHSTLKPFAISDDLGSNSYDGNARETVDMGCVHVFTSSISDLNS